MRKLPENPNNVIDRIEYKRPKVKYLTSSQVADFLEKIRDEHWYAAFVTDLGTGLRISELVALKWQEHVDLERGIIRVQGGRVEVKTHEENGPKAITILQSPKSEKGFRIVPLPDDVIEVLKTWKVRNVIRFCRNSLQNPIFKP
jgi:integrase